jgi:hypothetical protein
MQTFRTIAFLLVFWLPTQMLGQTLAKDARSLVKSIENLELRDSMSNPDSVLWEASANILAILYNYQAPIGKDSIINFNWEKFLLTYNDNPLISDLMQQRDFMLLTDSFSVEFNNLVWEKLDAIQSGPRQKMMDLLHAETTIKPSDYLSIAKTLHEYSLPPIQNAKALQIATKGANSNINYNLVDAQAVIKGLFDFIIERAQQEVVINFLERLLNEDTPKLKEIFPTVVERFSNQDFTYSNSFLERVRQAFYEDLQLLSVRLPELFLHEDYFHELQEDPVVYNLMVVYSMMGMAQQGVPIDEILPITHRFIYGRYADANKKINLHLAKKHFNKVEFDTVIQQTDLLVDSLRAIYRDMALAQFDIDLLVDSLELTYNTEDSLVKSFQLKPPYDLEILLGESQNFNFDLTLLPYMLEGKLDSAFVLKYNTVESYDKLFSIERNPTLWRAAGLDLTRDLNGTWYTNYTLDEIMRNWHRDLVAYNEAVEDWHLRIDTVNRLQEKWDEMDRKREHLRDTILATLEYWESNGSASYDQTLQFSLLAKIVEDFDVINELTLVPEELPDELPDDESSDDPQSLDGSEEGDPGFEGDFGDFDFDIDSLEAGVPVDTIDTPIEADSLSNPLDSLDLPDEGALDPAISSLSSEPNEENPSRREDIPIDTLENLRLKRERLLQIEERLFILNDTLSSRNPNYRNASPVVTYIFNKYTTLPYANILNKIDLFSKDLVDLQIQMESLDKLGGIEAKVKTNAEPVLQFTEVLTYLMYGLRTEEKSKHEDKWIKREELDELMSDPNLESAYLGLLYQRMSNIKDLGRFSPTALAQFIQSTVADISDLPREDLAKPATNDSLAFYRKLSFGVNMFNRLLELPLTVDPEERPDAQEYFKPIVKQKRGIEMGLDKIPPVTNQLTDFVYFLNVKDHRHAVSSGLRFFTNLIDLADKRKGPKCDSTVFFLKEYGGFIADLIDADSSSQVKDLMENIADPPGSSRIKRRKRMTVGLNAYVGASIGQETWDGITEVNGNYFDVSASIPIGIAWSWTSKRNYAEKKKPTSHSIFLSLLDIGEMLTLRDIDNADYESLFSFKNVFKPSLQYHLNLRRSPFYLGVGAQLGTQYFTLNGVEQNINSNKVFFSMGIDVPLKTFYQK